MVATRLYGDDELRVLWLTRGREELAVSAQGLWFRSGRRSAELTWDDLAQLQVTPVGKRAEGFVFVEVFPRSAKPCAVGPFAALEARRWLRACRDAAADHGERTADLDGADGFGLLAGP